MSQSSAPRRRFLPACAAVAASVAAVVATTAQPSPRQWWTRYGSSPDHSRYSPSKEITRRNVSRLQAAWTSPFGDTGSWPAAANAHADDTSRAPRPVLLPIKTLTGP